MAKKQAPKIVGGAESYLAVEPGIHGGYRLSWVTCDGRFSVEAGSHGGHAFRTESQAKAWGRQHHGRDAVRYTSYAKRPKNVCALPLGRAVKKRRK